MGVDVQLKFTPLEFETPNTAVMRNENGELKFTPLEFETGAKRGHLDN